MKKILALVLCLMMAFSMTAFAQEAPAVAVEDLYEGVWVQFEDGFEFYLPADWYQYEVTEEMIAGGVFYVAGTEDLSYYCTLGWQPLDAFCAIEDVQASMATVYPEATVIESNGVSLVLYVDAELDQLNFIALDAAEPGFYLFSFTPASDPDFQVVAALIASTIRNIAE